MQERISQQNSAHANWLSIFQIWRDYKSKQLSKYRAIVGKNNGQVHSKTMTQKGGTFVFDDHLEEISSYVL